MSSEGRTTQRRILFEEPYSQLICFHLQCCLHGLSICSQLSHVRILDGLAFAYFIFFFLPETVCDSFGHFITIFVYFIKS